MTQLPTYKRDITNHIRQRLAEKANLLQVIIGPRQVGKTTAIQQVLAEIPVASSYHVADLPAPPENVWIEQHWQAARELTRKEKSVILVLDEIQKINRWSEVVKKLWDEDRTEGLDLRVAILGSSSLMLQKGLSESLAGRFELMHCYHWSYPECRACFGWSLETYLYYGGYPKAATLIKEDSRWSAYVRDAIIEPAVSKDILLMNPIDKPALLRKVFVLACEYLAEIVSYQKMLGQLSDVGNTTTIAHYGRLLGSAYLIAGLEKFSGSKVRRRASSPKWIPLNTALVNALAQKSFAQTRSEHEIWGRLVECAVGAHLFQECDRRGYQVYYWREGKKEVDFVVQKGSAIIAIEVKSGRGSKALPGIAAFLENYNRAKPLLIGGGGIEVEEFLSSELDKFL